MSMPKFPEFDPEMTCNSALNMILASIAMEELALSHVINAEGEKLQYVLGTLETSDCRQHDIDEVLRVNQSSINLLDSVLQNQMLLKSKMDKALQALSDICPPRRSPVITADKCPCRSSMAFIAEKCQLWCTDASLHWNQEYIDGKCACIEPYDKTRIKLLSKGRFIVNFSINVKNELSYRADAAISLQMLDDHKYREVYTVYSQVADASAVTISISGIIIEISDHMPSALSLKLISSEPLMVEDAVFSIIEI